MLLEEKKILHKVKTVDEKYIIRTVKNAMQLLQTFSADSPEWTLTELASANSLEISQAKRLAKTLTDYGYLEKDPVTKRYRLGLAVMRLSGVLTASMGLYSEARPVLTRLGDKYDENVHIGILEETHVLYLDKFESLNSARLASHIGKRNPAYCTGCGKVLLAYAPEPLQQELLKKIEKEGLERFASNTVTSIGSLKRDLDAIVENGYALSSDELADGLSSLAVPIYDYTQTVVASISLTGTNSRINTLIHLDDLLMSSEIISKKLGYIKDGR